MDSVKLISLFEIEKKTGHLIIYLTIVCLPISK